MKRIVFKDRQMIKTDISFNDFNDYYDYDELVDSNNINDQTVNKQLEATDKVDQNSNSIDNKTLENKKLDHNTEINGFDWSVIRNMCKFKSTTTTTTATTTTTTLPTEDSFKEEDDVEEIDFSNYKS
jgi:hypothetical protein